MAGEQPAVLCEKFQKLMPCEFPVRSECPTTALPCPSALLVVPEDRPRVDAGETLHALPLGEDASLTTEFAL